MSFCRRLFATKIPSQATPSPATAPYLTTSPRAVRLRRARFPPRQIGDDGVQMSPSDRRRYERLKADGKLGKGDGVVPPEKWFEAQNRWRTRVRGVRYRKLRPEVPVGTSEEAVSEAAAETEQVVGQRIYLPNFIFRLLRNTTQPGQPYNPYVATFRIPRSINKLDIRSYLSAIYGVKCTFIRTENFVSQIIRSPFGGKLIRDSNRTYKRAVVGLVDPFYYPDAKEDMSAEEREAKTKWEDDNFNKTAMDEMRKQASMRIFKGWRWRSGGTANRDKILKAVMQRRAEREGLVAEVMKEMMAREGTPFRIVADAPSQTPTSIS